MPNPSYMAIEGAPGSVVNKTDSERDGTIEVLAFDHLVYIPTDADTGALTGVRKHGSLKITKEFDKASGALYDAVCHGKPFKKATINWYKMDDESGTYIKYFTHEIEDLKVSSVKTIMHNVKDVSKERYVHMEEVEFRYKKIKWDHVPSKVGAEDSWEENA